MRLHYYGAVSFMDSIVGRILDELEASGEANNTLVVFHADHGWAIFENGAVRKWSQRRMSMTRD
jgi:arylsulfatase A-like enzyme